LKLAVLAMATLGACEPVAETGLVVGNDGLGATVQTDNVRAAAGPDDAGVAVRGDRVVAGIDSDEAAAGVRIDGSPVIAGASTEGGRTFGGLGFGF
jgi:hypothetical protein